MGRKSFKDEIEITKYLTALAPQTFEFIESMYKIGDKKEKMWAVEQMIKLYGKAMPQAGDTPDNPIYQKQITGMVIVDESNAGTTQEQDSIPQQEPKTDPSGTLLAG